MEKTGLQYKVNIGKPQGFLFCLFFIVLICLILSSCGRGAEKEEKTQGELQGNQVEVYGHIITLNDEVEPVLEMLGDPKKYEEYPSCLYNGKDKTWDYGKIIISTYPDGEKDYISSIEIVEEGVGIFSGIQIGDSPEKLLEAYGERINQESRSIYRVDELSYGIDFYTEGDLVTGFSLYLIAE